MPKKVAHNCFQCSKLSHDEAQTKSCWDAVRVASPWENRCPNRRHYQRNKERISQQRSSQKSQIKRSHPTEKPTANQPRTIAIDHPIGTSASIIFYRERQDAPVHVVAAEVWQDSNKVLAVQPMHCLGLSPAQVVGVMTEILSACSSELEVSLGKYASKVELHPSLCPIRPCPLCERNNSTSNVNN
jgi:hypothetical protein